jgi:hypothetical protein
MSKARGWDGSGRRRGLTRSALAAMASACVLLFPMTARADFLWSAPTLVDQHGGPGVVAVACPSTSECAGIDGNGDTVTFDPNSGTGLCGTAAGDASAERIAGVIPRHLRFRVKSILQLGSRG